MQNNKISIIVPSLNEAENITSFLQHLQHLRKFEHEIILIDGGSTDDTTTLAENLTDKILITSPSRAKQMNAGAAIAQNETFLFLHADTRLPSNINEIINQRFMPNHYLWGRFDIQFSNTRRIFKLIALMINLRSRITGIATGDQALFINNNLFKNVKGFPEIPIMEDIKFSSNLKKINNPLCLEEKVTTSSRRWEGNGITRTILLMWWLRFLFFVGIPANRLVKNYYPKSHKEISLQKP